MFKLFGCGSKVWTNPLLQRIFIFSIVNRKIFLTDKTKLSLNYDIDLTWLGFKTVTLTDHHLCRHYIKINIHDLT